MNLRRIWQDIKEAIRGTDRDFTNIKLGRGILLLAIPMVLEQLMQSIFSVVDIFFVSKVGPDAVAAVGLTESFMPLVYSIGVGLSFATTAMVARRIGEKDAEGSSIVTSQAIWMSLGISLFLSIPGIIFADDLLWLMGASQAVIDIGSGYTAITIGSNGLIILLYVINAVFRSSGDAAFSMKVLWIANVINIILDPCLILGWGFFPELGVKGAAIATAIGRGVAIVYQFYLLFKGRRRVRLKFNQLKINIGMMKQLVSLSMGAIGQFIIAHSSWIGLVRIISVFGSEVLAGYTIAIRITIFSILPSWGLSNAASTLVGQNLGAKKPDRAERSVWFTGIVNMIFLGIIAVFLIIFSETFIRLFIQDTPVVISGEVCLRIISYGYIFYAMGMVMSQGFNGAGDTTTPMKINFFCFWLLEIPLAWFLAIPMGFKEKGVYIAILIAEAALSIVSVLVFRRGKWKERQV